MVSVYDWSYKRVRRVALGLCALIFTIVAVFELLVNCEALLLDGPQKVKQDNNNHDKNQPKKKSKHTTKQTKQPPSSHSLRHGIARYLVASWTVGDLTLEQDSVSCA